MKKLQIGVALILATWAFCLSAQAQKSFTYKAEDGPAGSQLQKITIIITERKNGYEVSGEYSKGDIHCPVRGSYFPAGQRLRATCTHVTYGQPLTLEITGFKLSEKDAFQIEMPGSATVVAWRDGIKPKDPSTKDETSKVHGACRIEGNWKQNTPGIGATYWIISRDGTATEQGIGYAKGTATMKDRVLHIDWKTDTGYSGYYEWTLDEKCAAGKGSLVFKAPRTDTLGSTVRRD